MSTIDLIQLRCSITDLQRSIVKRAWTHLLHRGQPISLRSFFHTFPREQAEPALEALGGKIIIQHYSNGISSFSPTLVGALLTSDAEHLEDLLCRCFRFVKEQYDANSDIRSITSEQLQLGRQFEPTEVEELRLLFSLPYQDLVVSGGGGQPGGSWALLVRDEVDQLLGVDDWQSYIRKEVMKGFDPSFPVYEGRRAAAASRYDQIRSVPQSRDSTDRSTSTDGESLQFEFVADHDLRRVLAADWQEVLRVLHVRAWKACVMLCGGILEGILLAVIQGALPERIQTSIRHLNLRDIPIERRGLDELLKLCEHAKLLDVDRAHLGQFIRAYRNLIHPGLQSGKNVDVHEEEAIIAVNAVRSIARVVSAAGIGLERTDQQ